MVKKQINKYMYIMYIEMPLIIICILYVYIYMQYIGGWVAKPNCRALGAPDEQLRWQTSTGQVKPRCTRSFSKPKPACRVPNCN